MGASDRQGGNGSDALLLWLTGGFVAVVFALKIWESVAVWLAKPAVQASLVLFWSVCGTATFYWLAQRYALRRKQRERDAAVLGPAKDAVFCGRSSQGEDVFIKTRQRSMHTQVIGTTNAGKTESVILPWAIQDVAQGRGLILIDGKADRSLLEKLWAYTVQHGREGDFRLFSLSSLEDSYQFNPLIGGSPEEISERVFNAFAFENEYYRSVQFEIFSQVMRVFAEAGEIPTFLKVFQAISEPPKLRALAERCASEPLKSWVKTYAATPATDLSMRTSGLTAALSHFAFGKTATLFNTTAPAINLDQALAQGQIIYFQLPVLLSPFLGKASGKMILQCLQSAIANRHRGNGRDKKFFSVFLDDFSEYLYPGFVSVLNKSRSASVGVVFAHQALGDIQTLGEPIANSILTNANLKVFMRGNDPESAEYFSKVIGTVKSVKYTAQTRRGLLNQEATGAASAREVDEFIIHPNKFKTELGVGEAVMVIPHEGGSRTICIKFEKFEDIPAQSMPDVPKQIEEGLAALPETETPKFHGVRNANAKAKAVS